MRYRVLTAILTALCGCSGARTPTAPSAAPSPNASDLPPLAGSYALTVELDSSCSQFPPQTQRRMYGVELVDHGWHFLPIEVSGGGYRDKMQIAALFSRQLSAPPGTLRLQWNEIDVGCDIIEPLGDSRRLAVCGDGPARQTDRGFDAAIDGIAVEWEATEAITCRGTHTLSFSRTR